MKIRQNRQLRQVNFFDEFLVKFIKLSVAPSWFYLSRIRLKFVKIVNSAKLIPYENLTKIRQNFEFCQVDFALTGFDLNLPKSSDPWTFTPFDEICQICHFRYCMHFWT